MPYGEASDHWAVSADVSVDGGSNPNPTDPPGPTNPPSPDGCCQGQTSVTDPRWFFYRDRPQVIGGKPLSTGAVTAAQIHTGALAAMLVAFPTAGSAEPPTLRLAPSALLLIMSTPECEGSLAKQQKSPPTRLLKSSSCQIKYQIAEKAEPVWRPGGCALVRSAVQQAPHQIQSLFFIK